MKKKLIVMMLASLFGKCSMAQAIDPISLVIAKAIKVIDLKVQRLQNETLVLQGLQQSAEQGLAKAKFTEITGWQQQLSSLYEGYYEELKQAKSAMTGGSMVKRILSLQQQVVLEYGRLGKDVAVKSQYDALLNNSMEILQTLQVVLTSQLSMKDAERISVILSLKDAMFHCLEGIQSLNKQQLDIISNRTRMQADLQFVKRLHGIQ